MSTPEVPARLGKYEVARRLAYGGMAEVLLGRLPGADGFSKDVVIKRVLPQYAAHAEFISMFRDEARITSELRHGNIVQVLEFGEEDGHFFLVLEYVHGQSLASILAAARASAERLSIAEVVHVATEIARALDYAHTKRDGRGEPLQIVHRDVTPSNILVSNEGVVKLADFGIAKARARLSPTQGGAGVLKGKLSYMAPETVAAGKADARSDLFALGIVLWEMLTGRSPFSAENEAQTILRITSETPHAPSSFRKGVPSALDDLVMRLLDRAPERRPARGLDVADALGKIAPPRAPDAMTPGEALARRIPPLLAERSPKPDLRDRETTRPSAKRRILVIEESRTLRTLVRAGLGPRFGVSEATTADDARARLAIEVPDAVICQRSLQGTSGLDLARWMRTVPALAAIPIVLLAAEATAELREEAMKAGVQALLPKRFDGDQLVATVERVIEEASAARR